jgi:hypothetical protein
MASIQPPAVNKAWEFHKDADSLLHSRISSFVLAQSFLVLGYIGSIASVLQHRHPTIVRLAIILLAMFYTITFWSICGWLFHGMENLKAKYLLEDDVYKIFYNHVPNKPGEGLFRYFIPHGLPALTLVFWLALAIAEFS